MGNPSRLPVVLSVPHGGTRIPDEVNHLCRLEIADILRDGDTWARELYSLYEEVAAHIHTDIARAVIDMNRPPDALPPEHPDGVVKTMTVEGVHVWADRSGLPAELARFLLEKYYDPYHVQIEKASKEGNAILGIDCHTMLGRGPAIGPDEGTFRPLICISNRGDEKGEGVDEPTTAPPEMVRALKDALIIQFAHEDVEVRARGIPVRINDPFRGGYICLKHGTSNSIPWIQFEINRALYLPKVGLLPEKPDKESMKRLKDLRNKFLGGLKGIF